MTQDQPHDGDGQEPRFGKWQQCQTCGHHQDVHGIGGAGYDPCGCCESPTAIRQRETREATR